MLCRLILHDLLTCLSPVLGNFVAVSISLILLWIFGEDTLEPVWRITFGIGCILPLTVFWFRLNIGNSRRYREEAIKSRVPYSLSFRRYWKRLLGSAGCWFLYDFVVFPNGTISSTIINSFVPDKSLLKTAEYQFLMTLLSFPGIFLGAWAVDKFV
ncbi:hypothetical protein BC937DRAFT_88913 [Endogone sp. FLAS-F59071]|nr:hypothetical protein BC937DRAFT_88913 [Endogone sp. FLAS-F59071]|eukprot:RUS18336.1 hypothetical protein BC937DRAFT_88913 [Endogone sp. FLAS-F59071]